MLQTLIFKQENAYIKHQLLLVPTQDALAAFLSPATTSAPKNFRPPELLIQRYDLIVESRRWQGPPYPSSYPKQKWYQLVPTTMVAGSKGIELHLTCLGFQLCKVAMEMTTGTFSQPAQKSMVCSCLLREYLHLFGAAKGVFKPVDLWSPVVRTSNTVVQELALLQGPQRGVGVVLEKLCVQRSSNNGGEPPLNCQELVITPHFRVAEGNHPPISLRYEFFCDPCSTMFYLTLQTCTGKVHISTAKLFWKSGVLRQWVGLQPLATWMFVVLLFFFPALNVSIVHFFSAVPKGTYGIGKSWTVDSFPERFQCTKDGTSTIPTSVEHLKAFVGCWFSLG